ncbi:MAG TPA: pyrroloquinoline quinone biosynthesis protein PqqE, partial [Methylotenera sp.]|nr:pyrroloquinoline quinone biosynthesis protein PqqE [Methylotenera sp.]
GDAEAADPVCTKSPHRHLIGQAIEDAKNPQLQAQPIVFRNDKNSKKIIDGEFQERLTEFHALP